MAKSTKRQSRETSVPQTTSTANETTSALEGRQAIHGRNEDYGDRVSRRAYELYLSRGRADGRDFDDWLTAEREIRNNREDHRRE
jgi:hypothetical protein